MIPAANISLLWPELPYLDRFEAAAAAGFTAVEVLFPYDTAAKETLRACTANGLELILMNAPPPNYTGGQRGFAAVPDLAVRFRSDVTRAYRFAEALNVRFLHIMTGEASGEQAYQTFVDNLIWAAQRAPKGLTLTIEPLNPVAMPGYFLNDYALARRVLAAVAMPNVALQYDSYHAQMINGDAVAVYDDYADIIAHVQIGDAPERTTPGSGTVDFKRLFARIADSGYTGWISGEYHPGPKTEDSLNWMKML